MHINDSDDKMIIFINKSVDLDEISSIILKIKNKNYEVKNFDSIVIYEDKNIGTILEINRGEENCFGVLDINVALAKEQVFLLKLEQTINFDINCDIYKYKNNYYLKIKESDPLKIGRILEYTKIIYGEEILKIMKEENKVKGGIII